MKKMKYIAVVFLLSSFSLQAQINYTEKVNEAEALFEAENYTESYKILKEIEPKVNKKDELYSKVIWYYSSSISQLEKAARMKEDWNTALAYANEALPIIKTGIPMFDADFASREYWMYKNIIVSYFGLNDLEKAMEYRAKLYAAYKKKTLPTGMDGYYNFEFFRWDNKNIWGYEWYPELGDKETEGSFSKIVYYVYSTNEDGSDKDQLYRLHVLKFHKMSDNSVDFDYVLTKRLETATNEVSGTLYAYTYLKKLDFPKIRADIREVLKGNYEPETKSVIKKN